MLRHDDADNVEGELSTSSKIDNTTQIYTVPLRLLKVTSSHHQLTVTEFFANDGIRGRDMTKTVGIPSQKRDCKFARHCRPNGLRPGIIAQVDSNSFRVGDSFRPCRGYIESHIKQLASKITDNMVHCFPLRLASKSNRRGSVSVPRIIIHIFPLLIAVMSRGCALDCHHRLATH